MERVDLLDLHRPCWRHVGRRRCQRQVRPLHHSLPALGPGVHPNARLGSHPSRRVYHPCPVLLLLRLRGRIRLPLMQPRVAWPPRVVVPDLLVPPLRSILRLLRVVDVADAQLLRPPRHCLALHRPARPVLGRGTLPLPMGPVAGNSSSTPPSLLCTSCLVLPRKTLPAARRKVVVVVSRKRLMKVLVSLLPLLPSGKHAPPLALGAQPMQPAMHHGRELAR
mmetsp:Transcript_29009/g.65739  ORF Transcript_29009/g.65739 Transcript_29009/m.65739 type:complete len:222 (+) Transcript_29009:718-1383(+)